MPEPVSPVAVTPVAAPSKLSSQSSAATPRALASTVLTRVISADCTALSMVQVTSSPAAMSNVASDSGAARSSTPVAGPAKAAAPVQVRVAS